MANTTTKTETFTFVFLVELKGKTYKARRTVTIPASAPITDAHDLAIDSIVDTYGEDVEFLHEL